MTAVRVKFLRGTSLGNGHDALPGDVVELDTKLVAAFVQQGRVLVLDASAAPSSAPLTTAGTAGIPGTPSKAKSRK